MTYRRSHLPGAILRIESAVTRRQDVWRRVTALGLAGRWDHGASPWLRVAAIASETHSELHLKGLTYLVRTYYLPATCDLLVDRKEAPERRFAKRTRIIEPLMFVEPADAVHLLLRQ